MALTVNDINIQVNHFVSLLITCFVCIDAYYFASAAICQHLNFL